MSLKLSCIFAKSTINRKWKIVKESTMGRSVFFWNGEPQADWGPNPFGDNLIWVAEGQIWKSFKYVCRHLDYDYDADILIMIYANINIIKVKKRRGIFDQRRQHFSFLLYTHMCRNKIKIKSGKKTSLLKKKQFPFIFSFASHPIILDRCLSGRRGKRVKSDNRITDIEVKKSYHHSYLTKTPSKCSYLGDSYKTYQIHLYF